MERVSAAAEALQSSVVLLINQLLARYGIIVEPTALVMVYQLVAVAFLLGVCYFLATSWRWELRMRNIPCAPGRLPVLGHVVALLKGNVWLTFTQWARQHDWAPYRIHALGETYVVFSEPSHVKQILQNNFSKYCKDLTTYTIFGDLLGTGLVSSEGESWRRQRTTRRNGSHNARRAHRR